MLANPISLHRKRRLIAMLLLVCGVGLIALFLRFSSQHERDKHLIAAVNRQDAAAVTSLLAAGANPNARDTSASPTFLEFLRRLFPASPSPLQIHLGSPNSPVLVLALVGLSRRRADMGDVLDENGENMSDPAVIAILRALLDKGADVRAGQAKDIGTVWLAAISDSGDAVALLVAHGADPNSVDPADGSTPLMLAAQHDYRSAIRQLLTCGANPNAKNQQGKTPLMLARENGNEAVAHLLLHFIRR